VHYNPALPPKFYKTFYPRGAMMTEVGRESAGQLRGQVNVAISRLAEFTEYRVYRIERRVNLFSDLRAMRNKKRQRTVQTNSTGIKKL